MFPAIVFEGTPKRIHPQAFAASRTNTGTNEAGKATYEHTPNTFDIYVPWSEGEVPNAPWGTTGTIHYNYEPNSKIIELEQHAATKDYVDASHVTKIKETLTKLFDREEFYEEDTVETGTLTFDLTDNLNGPAGDQWTDCDHDLVLTFNKGTEKASQTLYLPKGATIEITGNAVNFDTHFVYDGYDSLGVGIGDNDTLDVLFGFTPFTQNSNTDINKVYSDNTMDHTLCLDMDDSPEFLWNSQVHGGSTSGSTVTLNYTIYYRKNIYLDAISEL